MNRFTFLIAIATLLMACQQKYPNVPKSYYPLLDSAFVKSGNNANELKTALTKAPDDQKEGMAFLISYMPKRDLTSLTADYLLENINYAYKARKKFSWCNTLPDSIFFNEVLPYANITENRDYWRKDFYNRFSPYADRHNNITDAVMYIANNIKSELKVEYNTKRSRVDISPLQAIKEQMATCTGLSTLLTNAYRSVGIPSRLAGTAMWTNFKGNHTWCEVWIDGNWHFIEYYPEALDKSWFLADAGKADPDNMLHWIYAVSYKPTNLPYYAAVDAPYIMQVANLQAVPKSERQRFETMKQDTPTEKPYIWGHNVTQRYIDIYNKSIKNKTPTNNECIANFVVFTDTDTTKSESRLKCRIDLLKNDTLVDFGYSPKKTDDMNQFLRLNLKKNTSYNVKVTNIEENINQTFPINTNSENTNDFNLILKQN